VIKNQILRHQNPCLPLESDRKSLNFLFPFNSSITAIVKQILSSSGNHLRIPSGEETSMSEHPAGNGRNTHLQTLDHLDRRFGTVFGKVRAVCWLLAACASAGLAYSALSTLSGWPLSALLALALSATTYCLWNAYCSLQIKRASDVIIDEVQSRFKYVAPAMPIMRFLRDRIGSKLQSKPEGSSDPA
jgi:hypothetical protein